MHRFAPFHNFLQRESSSGILLLISAALGLLVANSPLSENYSRFFDYSFTIDALGIYLQLTILKPINYGLMTIFFFVVGLEIKRELTSGNLAGLRLAAAPIFGALGGMMLPALIYLAIAGAHDPRGWAIPVATDIALAVGLLSLVGSRASNGLKSFLLALAVIDDIGAIVIIALVFSSGVIFSWLIAAVAAVIFVLLLQRIGMTKKYLYFFLGIILWYGLYKSGVHPTIAGVIMGLLTPATPVKDDSLIDVEDGELTLVERLQASFHPLSALVVIPIFAFANSGVRLTKNTFDAALASPIAWGIFVGLVVGKPLGIMLTTKITTAMKVARLASETSPSALLAVGSTAGIGFTVAIFIAKLAFSEPALQDLAVTAVMAGSLLSGVVGVALFRLIHR